MNRLLALYKSTLGKKLVVAVTGIVLIGFLIGHSAGNLKIFLPALPDGTPDIDFYAHYLRQVGEPFLPHAAFLWLARIVLLGSLIGHVICVIQLSTANLAARQIEYDNRKFARATPSARWMMYTGGFLLFFVIVHLLHLTVGVFGSGFKPGMVYQNLHGSFTNFAWVLFLCHQPGDRCHASLPRCVESFSNIGFRQPGS